MTNDIYLTDAMARKMDERVRAGRWFDAMCLVSTEQTITLCLDLWPRIPQPERPVVLAQAIGGGDLPSREIHRLRGALTELRLNGQRAFDCDAARDYFYTLPAHLNIYRGTVFDEIDDYGVCWTLDYDTARWFVTEYGRFRNLDSDPVVLSAVVAKTDIAGLMTGRNEAEVLVLDDVLNDVRFEFVNSVESV